MQPAKFVEEMREALGAESAGLWIFFMDKVRATLPFLLDAAGRPKAEVVRSSVIGAAGFESWGQMVEASPDAGGLGWSIDSWKAWKKAYSVVLKRPYLRGLDLTASEVNTLSREFDPFPDTTDALEAAKLERKNRLDAKRGNSVSALKSQVQDLQGQLAELERRVRFLAGERDDWREKYEMRENANQAINNKYQRMRVLQDVADKRISELEASVESKNDEIAKLKKYLRTYRQMTWIDHLRAIFSKNN